MPGCPFGFTAEDAEDEVLSDGASDIVDGEGTLDEGEEKEMTKNKAKPKPKVVHAHTCVAFSVRPHSLMNLWQHKL